MVGTEKCKVNNWKLMNEKGKGKGEQTTNNTGYCEGGSKVKICKPLLSE